MIGERLRTERERLGFTQSAFAELAGAGRRTLIDWERGTSSPNAVQLSALSEAGLNVQWVVTGQASPGAEADHFSAVLVEQAVKEVVDLFSLEKAVNADQLAMAVVKFCRKANPISNESLTAGSDVTKYEGSQQNFYSAVTGDIAGHDIVKGSRK